MAAAAPPSPTASTDWYVSAMEYLVEVVQTLSYARDLDTLTGIVRNAARRLTGADGATFVLRDGEQCYYVDEDAVSPLWKGQRFPMNICISGWVMRNAQPAVIEDIYQDSRIPADAYRPTFVKSLAMVPIRKENPVGAIGNYWASVRRPRDEEVAVLQALANVTSVTLENIELYGQLQTKMQALEQSNRELSRFAWSAAHDLKSPLRAVDNITQWIEEDLEGTSIPRTRDNVALLRARVRRMERLLDDLLEYANIEAYLTREPVEIVDGATLIDSVLALVYIPPGFEVRVSGFDPVRGPLVPLQRIFCILINNAVKHHHHDTGTIEIQADDKEAEYVFSVADDGPGIDPTYREKIFEMFQTLQPRDKVEGSGMGLAIMSKILDFYGGRVEVESTPGRGAVFRFNWPKKAGHAASQHRAVGERSQSQ